MLHVGMYLFVTIQSQIREFITEIFAAHESLQRADFIAWFASAKVIQRHLLIARRMIVEVVDIAHRDGSLSIMYPYADIVFDVKQFDGAEAATRVPSLRFIEIISSLTSP